jgi:hypothetical protein
MPWRERNVRTRSPNATRKRLRGDSVSLSGVASERKAVSVTVISMGLFKLRENPDFQEHPKHALYCILGHTQNNAFIQPVGPLDQLFNAH